MSNNKTQEHNGVKQRVLRSTLERVKRSAKTYNTFSTSKRQAITKLFEKKDREK